MILIFIFGKYMWIVMDAIDFYQKGIVPENLVVDSLSNSSIINNIILSNLLMTNIPDLLFLLLSICLIFNGNKCFSKVISIISIIFVIPLTIFTLIGDSMDNNYLSVLPFWKYLLIGNGIQRMPFITSILLAFSSIGIYMSCKQYSRWSILSCLIILSFIFIYLKICSGLTNMKFNASGFSIYDWGVILDDNGIPLCQGIFYPLNDITNNVLLNIAVESVDVISIIFVLINFICISVLLVAKNLLTRSKIKIITIYQPWYHNSFLFREPFYRVDSWINSKLSKYMKRNYLYGMNKSNFFSVYYNRFLNEKEPIINNIKEDIDDKVSSKKAKINKRNNKKINNGSIDIEKNQNLVLNENKIINKPYVDNGKWYFENEIGEKFVANDNGSWERVN